MFNNSTILITGGTGTFGHAFVRYLVDNYTPSKIIIFSRDEFKQYKMSQLFADYPQIRFFIGDVRDLPRLKTATYNVDYIIHAAAIKQVVASEYNPFEAIKTNVFGAQNVIEAAIENGVKRVVALSTDKACNPVNLYGATKLSADKLFVAGNSYAGGKITRFSVLRYGNVLGSRGSVLPVFLKQRQEGRITVTHPDMTRFYITIDEAVRFVDTAINNMLGGEIFIPKIPSITMGEFAKGVCEKSEIVAIGVRPGEKMHEAMISSDDAHNTYEYDDHYRIMPSFNSWDSSSDYIGKGTKVDEGFSYTSLNNSWKMTKEDLRQIIKTLDVS